MFETIRAPRLKIPSTRLALLGIVALIVAVLLFGALNQSPAAAQAPDLAIWLSGLEDQLIGLFT